MHRFKGVIVRQEVAGQTIYFFVTNPADAIQRQQLAGQFYEMEDLALIGSYFPQKGTFLDIGANTGQHSVCAAKVFGAEYLILVEPTAESCELIRCNIRLNDLLRQSDLSLLGYGFSDLAARAEALTYPNNLGRTSLSPSPEGRVLLVPGDSMLPERRIDFIKIDVEGMELSVLRGLREVIIRDRPTIFLEVDDTNVPDFHGYLAKEAYVIIARRRSDLDNENYLIAPIERRTEVEDRPTMMSAATRRFCRAAAGLKSMAPTFIEASVEMAALPYGETNHPFHIHVIEDYSSVRTPRERFGVKVSIHNESDFILSSEPPHPVFIAYHLRYADGSIAVFEGGRTPLIPPLEGQSTGDYLAQIEAPREVGHYRLQILLVQEEVRWFESSGVQPFKGLRVVAR